MLTSSPKTQNLKLLFSSRLKLQNPLTVAVLAGLFYLLITLVMLWRTSSIQPDLKSWPHQFFLFIHPGSKWDFVLSRPFNTENIGYDGQFYYDLARSPLNVTTQLDKPAYRSARIMYPLIVRAFAFGQDALIPFMMLFVNFLAIVGTVFLLADLLQRLGQSVGWGLGYALWPGTFCAYFYDVSEPTCFFFVTAAIWLHFRNPQAVWRIGLLFFLGCMTKELALLFAVAWLLYYVVRRQWFNLLKLTGSWIVPFGVWQIYLIAHFGKDGLTAGEPFLPFPFGGYILAFVYQPPLLERLAILTATIIPLVWAIVGLYQTWRSRWPELLALTNHPLLYALPIHTFFLLFLPTATFVYLVDHARNVIGLIIILYLLPLTAFNRLRVYIISVSVLLTLMVAGFLMVNGNAFLYSFGI